MTMLTDSDDILRFRLKTLRVAIGLEVKGMTRRGRSATQIVRQEFGITKRRKIDVYFEFCRLTNQEPSHRMMETRDTMNSKQRKDAHNGRQPHA